MSRIIAIRHRIKKTKKGKAKPTVAAIKDGDNIRTIDLPDETAEKDFLLNRFPVEYRVADAGEDLSKFWEHHIKREIKKDEAAGQEIIKVPAAYEGFQSGDKVSMVLGGSGDYFAFALSRRAEKLGGNVMRIPGKKLKENRDGQTKEMDHIALIRLLEKQPDLFYPVTRREREMIRVRETNRLRRFTQRDRIAMQQRIYALEVGRIFLTEDDMYPEGTLEQEYRITQANHPGLVHIKKEEKEHTNALKEEVRKLDAWKEFFSKIEGIGEVLAGRMLSQIVDVRRFPAENGLKAYFGVSVTRDGKLPKNIRKHGQANGLLDEEDSLEDSNNPDEPQHNRHARQAVYLLGDQFIFRPNSEWGKKLRHYQQRIKANHPEVEVKNGRKRYTKGDIFTMAFWRTLSKFVVHMHRRLKGISNGEHLVKNPEGA